MQFVVRQKNIHAKEYKYLQKMTQGLAKKTSSLQKLKCSQI